MKQLLLLTIILLSSFHAHSQSDKQTYQLNGDNRPSVDMSSHFTDYELISIDLENLNQTLLETNLEIDLTIILDNREIRFNLYSDPIVSADYKVTVYGQLIENLTDYSIIKQEGNITTLKPRKSITYKGYTDEGGEIRLTITSDFIFGSIKSRNKTYFIESLRNFDRSLSQNGVVVYTAGNIIFDSDHRCGVEDVKERKRILAPEDGEGIEESAMMPCEEVELAIAHDVEMYVSKGSVAAAVNHGIAVMHLVNGDYATAFNSELRFYITEQVVYTDYYDQPSQITNNPTINSLLDGFTAIANSQIFSGSYDLGQLWTGRNLSGSTIGLAWVGATCGSYRYHVLENYSANMQGLRVLTSHEIGHNFDCGHNGGGCQAPGGHNFIMNPTTDPNATEWSTGAQGCEQNSIGLVNDWISGSGGNCFAACPTGVTAEFTASENAVCEGATITFTDISLGNATSWLWTFPGGTPGTSTVQNPTVTYNTAGEYDVTLQVNAIYTETKTNFITIDPVRGGSFCDITSGPLTSEGIKRFVIQDGGVTIFDNRTPSPSETKSIFSDFTCKFSPVLEINKTYEFYYQIRSCGNSRFQAIRMYVDYNNNGAFEGSEQVLPTGSIYCGSGSFNITIPSSATLNTPIKTRVITSESSPYGPCTAPNISGEVEDYVLTFIDTDIAVAEAMDCNATIRSVSGSSFIPIYFQGKIIAEINPNGQDLGNLILKYNKYASVPQSPSNEKFLPRAFSIHSSKSFSNPVTLRYYFLDSELADYNAAVGESLTINELDISYFQHTTPSDEDCDISNNTSGTTGIITSTGTNYDVGSQNGFYLQFDTDHFSEYAVVSAIPLPVKFLSFKGEHREGHNILNWKTVLEENNSYFAIERSHDGHIFNEIGQIKGAGSTSSIRSYTFKDEKLFSDLHYYRLKQYDYDGIFSYSDVILLRGKSDSHFAIYPNPLSENQELLINAGFSGNFEVVIYNNKGKKMIQRSYQPNSSSLIKMTDLQLENGIYYVSIISDNYQQNEKLVVIR